MLRQVLLQVANQLRLNLRNPMAMIYGYAFPLLFLLAFRAIYHSDRVPLLLHMGQLLTVTILGGACFGLPTTIVSERERGVWRRYRLSPAPAWVFVAGVLVTRMVLLLSAALLQLGLALLLGMTPPHHPGSLLVAFTAASVAFLGMGLVIAVLADTVPAVQALGQCIFLPMLMVGGVAVRLSSLPHWALDLSAFLPGRYAVELLQASTTGAGLKETRFDLLALLLMGAAAFAAAVVAFRWNPRERSGGERGKGWLLIALSTWVIVGILAEHSGRIGLSASGIEVAGLPQDYMRLQPAPMAEMPEAAVTQDAHGPAAKTIIADPTRPVATTGMAPMHEAKHAVHAPSSWQAVSDDDIRQVAFDRLPSDEGIISPVAHSGETLDPSIDSQLEQIRTALATWEPGRVSDPVQRARNDLYVAAVPDVLQMEQVERFVPLLVFSRLKKDVPPEDLPKVLYWIAMHPAEGDSAVVHHMEPFGLPSLSGPTREASNRVMLYALKLLGRITGAISA